MDKEYVVHIRSGMYSSLKKNEMIAFASKWKEHETIMLREISQGQKVKDHMFDPIPEC